jgi:hypothetical protein
VITHTIPIRDDVQAVFLEAYLLKDSPEFQTGMRRPAVIVCPGGAYMGTSDREAEPVALRFLARGYGAQIWLDLALKWLKRQREQQQAGSK